MSGSRTFIFKMVFYKKILKININLLLENHDVLNMIVWFIDIKYENGLLN